MKNILLIVDPQNDFITGTLPVVGAEEKMKLLAQYLQDKARIYDYICITLDSHTEYHCSFTENGGIWPKHCISNTVGWDLPGYLDAQLWDLEHVRFYHKGYINNKEEYSIFANDNDGRDLSNLIQQTIKEGDDVYVDICGIAGDYCVLETLKGLTKIMGNQYISVLSDLTASIDGGEKLTAYAEANEISIITNSFNNLTPYEL